MIFEVEKEKYSLMKDLFNHLSDEHMSVVVALENNYPSRVFVDNLEHPTSGFIYLGRMTFGFCGRSDNEGFNSELKRIIDNELLPLIKNELKVKELIIRFTQGWKKRIPYFFDNIIEHELGNYIFDELKHDYTKFTLPEGYEYVSIDEDLLQKEYLKNFYIVERWVKGCYLSTEDYLARGFGFCIIHKDEIASTCMCNYISKDRKRCEIGIITSEGHRLKGLGKNLVSRTVSHCLDLNIERIDWQSRLNNIGSIRIAEAVGFQLDKLYTGFVLELN
jgi:RimJ/RimL family protein N-acetyltransferase